MLIHIEEELLSTMHLLVSSDDTLYFYRYLCTHVLVVKEQFLLIIDVPIQDCTEQFEIYQVFSLLIPKGSLSAWYDIETKYLGISQDDKKAVEILEQQFTTRQWANGQFCNLDAPLQPLTNPPTCITAIYAKNEKVIEQQCSLQIRNTCSSTIPMAITSNLWLLTSTTESDPTGVTLIYPDKTPLFIKVQKPIHIFPLPAACSAMSWHFHVPLHCKEHQMMINVSLNTANLNRMNISSPKFKVWQHLEDHWNKTQLHKLANIPTVPIAYLYKHMITNNRHIIPFTLSDESVDDTASVWTLCSHTGIYVMAIGSLIPTGLAIFCCYFFWCWPARLAHQPLL